MFKEKVLQIEVNPVANGYFYVVYRGQGTMATSVEKFVEQDIAKMGMHIREILTDEPTPVPPSFSGFMAQLFEEAAATAGEAEITIIEPPTRRRRVKKQEGN